jgi:hypothetical protein
VRHILSIVVAITLLVYATVPGKLHAGIPSGKLSVPVSEVAEESSQWSFSASVTGYAIPDDRDYLSPLLSVDRGWLHLEARHNYESLDTASVWLGYNLSFGEKWVLDLTPMVGGVFGDSRGIAPGWRLGISRGSFEFTTEAEYFFDSESSDEDYFYAWSELTWAFTDSFWAGFALQRTRAFETDLDIQRGILIGVTFHEVDITAYVFNWGWTDPTFVLSIGWEF